MSDKFIKDDYYYLLTIINKHKLKNYDVYLNLFNINDMSTFISELKKHNIRLIRNGNLLEELYKVNYRTVGINGKEEIISLNVQVSESESNDNYDKLKTIKQINNNILDRFHLNDIYNQDNILNYNNFILKYYGLNVNLYDEGIFSYGNLCNFLNKISNNTIISKYYFFYDKTLFITIDSQDYINSDNLLEYFKLCLLYILNKSNLDFIDDATSLNDLLGKIIYDTQLEFYNKTKE